MYFWCLYIHIVTLQNIIMTSPPVTKLLPHPPYDATTTDRLVVVTTSVDARTKVWCRDLSDSSSGVCARVYACAWMKMGVCVHACVCMCACVCVRVYVFMCACARVHVFTCMCRCRVTYETCMRWFMGFMGISKWAANMHIARSSRCRYEVSRRVGDQGKLDDLFELCGDGERRWWGGGEGRRERGRGGERGRRGGEGEVKARIGNTFILSHLLYSLV